MFFIQAEDGIRDYKVTGVQTCALPISLAPRATASCTWRSIFSTARALIMGPICEAGSLAGPTCSAATRAASFCANTSCTLQCTKTRLGRSEEHTSELQSPCNLVCRLLLEKKT